MTTTTLAREEAAARPRGRLAGLPRLLVLAAALAVLAALLLPLWNMTMFAPQYPDGLRLDVRAGHLAGGRGGQDVREINVLNHYIGMHELDDADFPELRVVRLCLVGLAGLLVVAALLGRPAGVALALCGYAAFGGWGLYAFAGKMYRYGHELSPVAAVKVPPFMPPLFGYRQMANFEVYSYPAAGSYALAAAAVLLVAALVLARRSRTA